MERWPQPRRLLIGLLVPKKNQQHFNNTVLMARSEDNPIPAYDLAVLPFPIFALESLYISAKRVLAHLSKMPSYDFLTVGRNSLKLSFGFFCEPDGPSRFRVAQELQTPLVASGPQLCVGALPVWGSGSHRREPSSLA